MTKKSLILVGGGGHCKACIDVVESNGEFKIAGIVDAAERLKEKVLNYKIVASDKDFKKLVGKYKNFIISMGSIKDPSRRIEKFEALKHLGASFPVIVSSFARVAKSAFVDEGTIVMHQAVVNADAKVGKNCIINTAAVIEHDVKVGDHCHVSTGAIINGKSQIGNRVFIGSLSVVVHDVSIADDVVIGAGSVVVKSIQQPGVYVGNPARRVK